MGSKAKNGNKGLVRTAGDREALWAMGLRIELVATSEETGGAATILEATLGPGLIGAPPHRHPGGEHVHVVEGTVRYHVGNETFDVSAGSDVFLPKGTLEWFENVSSSPAKLRVTYMPGGIEAFFREVGQPAGNAGLPPPGAMPDAATVARIAKKYDLEILPFPKSASSGAAHP